MLLSFERLEFSFVLSNQSVLSDRLLKQNFLINSKKSRDRRETQGNGGMRAEIVWSNQQKNQVRKS